MASVSKARKNVSRNAAARLSVQCCWGSLCQGRVLSSGIFSTVLFGRLNKDQVSQHDLGCCCSGLEGSGEILHCCSQWELLCTNLVLET